ncbi:twitching motility protein PilT [Pseudomonas aeruginosa]|uniref:ATPase, T2SS/T4P/T4SS family n=1 Tax=Pseudomonas aeruginosa TaxID=287 RepID=UPI001BCA1C30|nr:twitching motility protein PilT [Pseudomonas aeruginosa]MCO2072558.1 twitching motility protein PilT [Pseudomonas aeruginosa]
MSVNPIIQAQFVDLYLGEGFADVKGLAGASARRVEVPREWESHAQELLQHCRQTLEELQDPEFAIVVDGVLLRVTLLEDAFSGSVFVLRRSTAQLREFQEIGYPSEVVSALMDPQLQGLVLFCGEMATGKTSSAASLLLARLQELGGVGCAVEDPQETNLSGQHGLGRCIQVRTSRRSGGYSEALLRTLRAGADLVLIGEIRDEDTAYQACKASLTGSLVIATIHAKSCHQAIERLVTLAQPLARNAYDVVAEGIQAVICQALESDGSSRRLTAEPLLFTGDDGPSMRDKIRRKEAHLLQDDQARQSRQSLWR